MRIKKYNQFITESSGFELNSMIDYTLLDESSSENDIINLCESADKLGVKSVCVLPKMVKIASERLSNSKVLVCTVISFPGGDNSLQSKISETNKVISDGADEVDMVLDYKKLKQSGLFDGFTFDYLIKEVESLVNICHSNTNKDGDEIILKVIVESGLLNEEETKMATEICLSGGADFIKTSTGKVSIGAELNKIKIMYDIIKDSGRDMMIKASGGVRTEAQMRELLPYVDRFGMGYASVDTINGVSVDNNSSY